MYRGLITIFFLHYVFVPITIQASESGIPAVRVMQRIDTSNPTVRVILAAWVDSLATWRSIQTGTTEWNIDKTSSAFAQKKLVLDWFGQSGDIIKTYPPTIMSIEPNEDVWFVRTLFATVDTHSGHVIPLGILRTVFSIDDNKKPQVDNPYNSWIKNWNVVRIGPISFYHPHEKVLSRERMDGAVRYMESVSRMFDVEPPTSITMVVARNRDEMCNLLGIEFYAFPPTGIAYPEFSLIISGLNDPYYPHEITHVVLRELEKDAHPIIREGVATWLGGSINDNLAQLVVMYLEGTPQQDIPSFVGLFTNPDISQDDQYVLGAVVCEAIAQRHGVNAIKRLLAAKSTSEVMLLASRYLDLDPSDKQESLIPFLNEVVSTSSAKPGH